MKVLVLGDGKLGTELVKQTGWDYISRKKNRFNIHDLDHYNFYIIGNFDGLIYWKEYDVVVNCIANTNTYGGTKDDMYRTNFLYPKILSDFCKDNTIKLIHISTDYVYSNSEPFATENSMPIPLPTWYGYYKLLADEYISSTNPNHLICRCSFKSNPFEFDKAWINQIGNFDYVDVISELIINLIEKNATGIFNVGTELKTMYDLAKRTNPNVIPILKPKYVPMDITINTDKLKNFLNK
jgi:dTDP-4-dehydrorhamnose reductase